MLQTRLNVSTGRQLYTTSSSYAHPLPLFCGTYGSPSNLFFGGECLLSREGTTQGDPLAMGMYAVGIIPVIKELHGNGGIQLWCADDASDAGSLKQIRSWWDVFRTRGPSCGYFPNHAATKSWLLVKENVGQQVRTLFEDSGINITIEGRRLLGAALGTEAFVTSFIAEKVTRLPRWLPRLAEFAKSQPHAAYIAYKRGLSSEFDFLNLCQFRNRRCILARCKKVFRIN